MGAIVYEQTPVLSSSTPHVPLELGEIVSRMLMKDPANRYPSAGEVRDELIRFRSRLAPSAKAFSPRTIAILPFVDLSPDRDQEFFCDGLAEELITVLNTLDGLRVASRTSSFRFRGSNFDTREVREGLKVETVLEGSVRKAQDKIRIVVNLVDLETGFPVWSQRYDRQLDDVFKIQDEIAEAIVQKLKVSISSVNAPKWVENSPDNIRAYESYLRGRYYWNKRTEENLKRSVDFFQKALGEDPDYALALAGLAESYVTLGFYGALPPSEVMPAARQSAERALARRHEMPEALNALATIYAVYDWDWASAERNFKRAIGANPNYAAAYQWYAINCLVPCGRFTEARAAIQRALELEPLSLTVLATSGLVSYYQHEYEPAITEYRKALELDANFGIAHYFLGQAYLGKGLIDEAVAELEQSVMLTNRSPECVAVLGYAYAVAGNQPAAAELARELETRSTERYISPVLFAWIQGTLLLGYWGAMTLVPVPSYLRSASATLTSPAWSAATGEKTCRRCGSIRRPCAWAAAASSSRRNPWSAVTTMWRPFRLLMMYPTRATSSLMAVRTAAKVFPSVLLSSPPSNDDRNIQFGIVIIPTSPLGLDRRTFC